jgi:hypothetical protein
VTAQEKVPAHRRAILRPEQAASSGSGFGKLDSIINQAFFLRPVQGVKGLKIALPTLCWSSAENSKAGSSGFGLV